MPDPRIYPVPLVVDTFATVGVISAAVRNAEPNRVEADFVNTSAFWIYLARGNAAVVGSGQPLAPRGGSYHIGVDNLFNGIINAISTDADANLSISVGWRRK